jgi:hypothetical protein
MRSAFVALAAVSVVAAVATGCEKSCKQLEDEWHAELQKYAVACTSDDECMIVHPAESWNVGGEYNGCSITGGCAGAAAGVAARNSERLASLGDEWAARRCGGSHAICDCPLFPQVAVCSSGGCGILTLMDGGMQFDAHGDAYAPQVDGPPGCPSERACGPLCCAEGSTCEQAPIWWNCLPLPDAGALHRDTGTDAPPDAAPADGPADAATD